MKLSRVQVGNLLYYIGLLGLPLGVGAALGFYAGAWGMRWLPTMLEIFLMTCLASLLAIIGGRMLEGSALKMTEKGLRLRRRVITAIVFVSVLILGRLGVYWAQQPSPLTELSPVQFNMVFETDLRNYFEYDKGLERHIETLEEYSKDFGPDRSRLLTAAEEKLLRDIWTSIYDYAFAMDQIRVFYEDWYRFDPTRSQCSYHHRSFLLTLAAELSLYEKSTRFINLVSEYENVVKFLNTPHAGAGLEPDSFSRFRQEFQGSRDQGRILAGRQYLLWLEKGLKGREVIAEAGCSDLWEKVEFEIALINRAGALETAGSTVKGDIEPFNRAAGRIWFNGQRGVARWMGNTRIKRIGRYLIGAKQRGEIEEKLEPGDILLSRKNWYLSNVGLPGFWPHAIFYLGSPDKFERYFDEAEVLAFVREISGENLTLGQYMDKVYPKQWLTYQLGRGQSDYCVIEGLSCGVIFNTMEDTCGDYMAAVRPRLSKKAKAQAILEAFSHHGKAYDYDFDFATDHALVCTELVWRSYRADEGKDGLEIQLVEMAGRKTLPANEIANLFAREHGGSGAQFDFVCFVDASEKTQETFFSTEEEFLLSCERVKWSFALE